MEEVSEILSIRERVESCHLEIDTLKTNHQTYYDAREEKPDSTILIRSGNGLIQMHVVEIGDDLVNGKTYINLTTTPGKTEDFRATNLEGEEITVTADDSEIFTIAQNHPKVKEAIYNNIIDSEFPGEEVLRDLFLTEWVEIEDKLDIFKSKLGNIDSERLRQIFLRLVELGNEVHEFDRNNPFTRKKDDMLENAISILALKLEYMFPNLKKGKGEAKEVAIFDTRAAIRKFYLKTGFNSQTKIEENGEKVAAQNSSTVKEQMLSDIIIPSLAQKEGNEYELLKKWLLGTERMKLEELARLPVDDEGRIDAKKAVESTGLRPHEFAGILARLADIEETARIVEEKDLNLPSVHQGLTPKVLEEMKSKIENAIYLLDDRVVAIIPEEIAAAPEESEQKEFYENLKTAAVKVPEGYQEKYIQPMLSLLPKFPELLEGVDLTEVSKETLKKIKSKISDYETSDPNVRSQLGQISQGIEALLEYMD